MEIFSGEKATALYGQFFPEETLHALREFVVSIKGPLGTPIGGGIRSLNVAMRQNLDLYACVRPIRYFPGVASPMQDASLTDMVVFRENTEDIYAGIEWPAASQEVQKLIAFLQRELHVTAIRFPASSGIGIKPVSKEGSQRLDPQGHPVRHRERPCLRDPRAQGQHHEVHGGRLLQLGLPARQGRVRRAPRSAAARGSRSRARSPARTS